MATNAPDPGTKNTVPRQPLPLIERNALAPGSVTRKAHQDLEWTRPTFLNAWGEIAGSGTTYPYVGYAMDNEGFIHLRGVLINGANGTAAFNLEPYTKYGAAPGAAQYIHAGAWHNTGAAYYTAFVRVENLAAPNAPNCVIFFVGALGAWISLDGCTFDMRA